MIVWVESVNKEKKSSKIYDFKLTLISTYEIDDDRVSSSRIRKLLKDGDIITLDYEGRTEGVLFDTTLEKVAKKEDAIVELVLAKQKYQNCFIISPTFYNTNNELTLNSSNFFNNNILVCKYADIACYVQCFFDNFVSF